MASGLDRPPGFRPAVDGTGRIAVPAGLASRLAGAGADDLVWEAAPGGLAVAADCLRKVYVEVTGRCNLRCAMCPRGEWAAGAGDMADARYRSLLDGLPDAPPDGITLAFGGFGEPTAHPGLLDLIDLARGRGRRVEIVTNGTLVTPSLAAGFAASGVAQVTVSVDGGDDEVFRAMRGAERAHVLQAVALLRDCARRAPGHMTVGLACVATRRTVASLPALLEAASRLRVDFVSITNVVPHTRQLADEALFEHAAQVSDMSPDAWRPRVRVARFDASEAAQPLLDALFRQLPVVPPPALDRGEWHNQCRFARDGVVAVSWDGRVAPCLSLLYTHTEHLGGREKTVRAFEVGHLDRAPLAAIWRDPQYRAIRARLRAFDVSPGLACGGCDISETNEADCFGTPFPACSECLWAQGIVLCP